MPKLCGECYYLGDGKTDPEGSITAGGFSIGLAFLILFFTSLLSAFAQISALIVPIVAFSVLILGIQFLWNIRKSGKVCPVCNYKPMLALESDKAKSIIAKNEKILDQLDNSTNDNKYICKDCNHISNIVPIKSVSLSGAIFLIIIGLPTLIYSWLQIFSNGIAILSLTAGIIWFLFGMYMLIRYFYNSTTCPSCNSKALIPLDSPRAQELIKQNNLTITSD